MLKVMTYSKSKGQKNYRKNGDTLKYTGKIKDWQVLNGSDYFKNKPNKYDYRSNYSNSGKTYTRVVKSKKTGISWKTVVKEY